ncbi:MAG TPA: nucleotide exchange factor GrpE [Brevundimonas sp.]|uniref:nucleotide exchange factor GrpE n=1 Tax=Brevundimonas sp. TaxID=1871086 RepID=UPI002639C311|nr:nucleotide exchange factor GrpE [Brevundimonas sp.]HRO32386.1 nucleotide exchange factor GrpE [Brevundimonas sp.]
MNETPENDPIETELDADIAEAEAEEAFADPLDAVIAERDQWRDRALRAAAEAENVKRRTEGQMNDARAYAIQRFARDLLGVADNLERALQAAPQGADGAAAGLVTGLEMTQKSLLAAFEASGLKRVAPGPGEAFDPHLHQAMMEQPSAEVPPGTVIQTLQPGYALFDRTVRAAMVVVAAKGAGGAAKGPYAEAGTNGGTFDAQA